MSTGKTPEQGHAVCGRDWNDPESRIDGNDVFRRTFLPDQYGTDHPELRPAGKKIMEKKAPALS